MLIKNKSIALQFVIIVLLLTLSVSVSANNSDCLSNQGNLNKLSKIDVEWQKDFVELTIYGKFVPIFSSFILSRPERLIFDFPATCLDKEISTIKGGNDLVRKIDIVPLKYIPNTLRLTILSIQAVDYSVKKHENSIILTISPLFGIKESSQVVVANNKQAGLTPVDKIILAKNDVQTQKLLEEQKQLAKDRRLEEEKQQKANQERLRVAEEKRLKEEAEFKRLEEERQLKAEQERLRVAEEKRLAKEAEFKRLEEERQLKAEQERLRIVEEKRLAKEAEIKRLEEEKRFKAEQEHLRIVEEKRLKEEAERRRLEEERRFKAEQERLRITEEKRLKEEAEQKRLEEERRFKAEQERLRIAEVKRLQEEAERRRLAEEQSFRAEQERLKIAEAKRKQNLPKKKIIPVKKSLAVLKKIGFHPEEEFTKIRVDFNTETEIRFDWVGRRTLLFTFSPASVSNRRNLLPLNTAAFGTSVLMIRPDWSPSKKEVTLKIELSWRKPFKVIKDGKSFNIIIEEIQ